MADCDYTRPYGIIYLVTNTINGMIYIGQTIMTLKERWKGHCNTPSSSRLRAAIRKYGRESFTIVKLADASSREELNELECKLIARHNATDRSVGYNFSPGGAGAPRDRESIERGADKIRGRPLSQEHKEKISARKTGVKATPEHVEKMRAAKIAAKFKHTPESRKKMSEALMGRKRPSPSDACKAIHSANMKRIWAERKAARSKRIT